MPTADVVAYPTQFWHPVQNLTPGGRVAAVSPIGPSVRCFGDLAGGDAVDERVDRRGVALAGRVHLDGGPSLAARGSLVTRDT